MNGHECIPDFDADEAIRFRIVHQRGDGENDHKDQNPSSLTQPHSRGRLLVPFDKMDAAKSIASRVIASITYGGL